MKISITDLNPSDSLAINAAVELLQRLGAVAHAAVAVTPPPVPPTSLADDVAAAEQAFAGASLDDAAAAFGAAPNVPPPPVAGSPATTTPATVSSAPAAPNVPPAVPATAGVDLDKNGLPWDGRIHAGTRGKNTDGSWTAKRGVDKNIVPGVEAELRAVMALPGASAPAAPLPLVPPPPVAQPLPVPQPPVAPVPAAAQAVNFATVVQTVARLTEIEKLITQADVKAACDAVGVPSLPIAASRPDLLQMIYDIIIATADQRRVPGA